MSLCLLSDNNGGRFSEPCRPDSLPTWIEQVKILWRSERM